MFIEFKEGSAVEHPNFERYMWESIVAGSIPLRFDCAAALDVSSEHVAASAQAELERRAVEEEADILQKTLCATRVEEPPGQYRFRVIVIARVRKAVVETVIVREAVDPSGA